MHLKHIKHIIILAGCLFMLAACTNKPIDQNIKQQNNQGLELNKINANSPVDQQSANRAKHLLNKYEEIKSVSAVNLKKKITKNINKHFPDLKVTLSTDEKIHLEIKKLEQALQERKLSKKELADKIKKIISLSKEKT